MWWGRGRGCSEEGVRLADPSDLWAAEGSLDLF